MSFCLSWVNSPITLFATVLVKFIGSLTTTIPRELTYATLNIWSRKINGADFKIFCDYHSPVETIIHVPAVLAQCESVSDSQLYGSRLLDHCNILTFI
jgi:hypothetical protein